MRYFLLCCCLLMTTFLADSAAPGPPVPTPFAAQWRKIDALLAKEQTATAAPLVEKIYQQARRANNAPAYVRALLYKIRLLENKENDADEKAIALLEKDVRTATFPARPILHSLLAGLYADYYNQHRYQLYERTNGAAPSTGPTPPADAGPGLATWDAGRLAATIVRHYEQSVVDPARQLKTTLAQLGDLATGGDAEGRARRPTLYDLLAQRAIVGLQNQELYITRPAQQWQPTDPRLFGSAAEFAALKLTAPAPDSLNGPLRALQLLQRLTAARLAAGNATALADVDLQRLDFLRGLTQGTELADEYEPALARLAETYRALPLSAEAVARRAQARRDAGDNGAAVALTRAAEARFPQSRGAARARQLRAEIERPELAFTAADVVVPGQPWRLDLTTRNVAALHAWAYRITLGEWEQGAGYDPQRPLNKRFARALRAAPAATWAVPVPAPLLDYKEQKLAAAGPALPVGYYLIFISNKARLSTDAAALSAQVGTVTAYALVGASQLSAVHRADAGTGATSLLLLDRQSGAPLAGVPNQAAFNGYNRPRQRNDRRLGPVLPTDATGEVALPGPREATDALGGEQLRSVRSWQGRDTLLTTLNRYYYSGRADQAEQPRRRTFLFTDRAIYRPGQTLYFKGILTEKLGSEARLLPGQPVSVRLLDVNGQTVQTLSFTTSDFGSFHGSLVLPAGLLNGEMRLQTDDGSLGFAVEDYKRPTFLVTLDSVPGRPQLGLPLTVGGRARAYAGPPTDGATVRYRVTRRTLWALDYDGGAGGRFGRPYPRGGDQEITHGTTTTDAEGRFALTFTPPLAPAPPGRGGWQPGFLFEITADVTDAAGETRTGTRAVPLGRNPLSLRLAGPNRADQQALPPFRLLSTNATGEPLPAAGTLRLLRRAYRPNPPGVPGPTPETDDNEAAPALIQTLAFDTKTSPDLDLRAALAALPTGRYRLEALAAGPDSARARLDFTLYDSQAATVPYATPDWFVALPDSVAPGQPAAVLLGSSDADARILLETERGGQLLRAEWLTLKAGEQRRLTLDSGPADARGPLYIHTTQVRAGRLYRHDATVQVAEKPRPLTLSLATFRDKLTPGQRETWRVTIRQATGQPADAELLATLYDQSLDAFRPHSFMELNFGGDYYPARFAWQGGFEEVRSDSYATTNDGPGPKDINYPELNDWQRHLDEVPDQEELEDKAVATVFLKANTTVSDSGESAGPARAAPMLAARVSGVAVNFSAPVLKKDEEAKAGNNSEKNTDLSLIPARTDFRETAFWQPALRTDKNGDVVLEFQMPEAVTRWQLLALAHDKQLRSGQLTRQLVTQKQIQLTPNAPRFLRPGDAFTFPAKFSNLTDHATSGTAQLFLLDAATGQDITSQLLRGPAQLPVRAAAHQSQALGWPLALPPDFSPVAVTYRVVAQSQAADGTEQLTGIKARRQAAQALSTKHQAPNPTYSDGEENTLPVLPNKILITESRPLPLAGAGTREFELTKLTSTSSPTRRNYSLTLEMTANPAWYAVQSLPYLMEYPYECAEQTFNRLYANLLAAQILRANPRFQTTLAEWARQAQSGSAAQRNQLESKLAQNQDLKNLLLQETPWVGDAQDETARLAQLSRLFDEARLRTETAATLAQLRRLQLPGGAFPWFAQMPADRYITQLIVAGFGKLQKLGAFDASQDEAAREVLLHALRYLDAAQAADYAALRRQPAGKLTADHLSDLAVQALYARSFWPQVPASAAAQTAAAYYRGQAAAHWAGRPRYLQAQLALSLSRASVPAPAAAIMRALTENALHSPELGMYWQDVRPGYYWREAPTETQATLIEAFDEIKNDQPAVAELKLWLLTQKQTHHWPSTRATADACYALLRGPDWLAPTPPLQVEVGGQAIQPEATQAGTGYYKATWPAAAIKPALGRVRVGKASAGPAWGALYWQYFENLDRVTPAATPLSLERQLYRETRTAAGPQLEPLSAATPLHVGDALVVRLVLRTDRALEYVHLQDQRAAGLEPLSPVSGYRSQGGLGYYESPRDAATHFFLSTVPRGTHVFEYRLRAAQAGDFSGGLSRVQCWYAPEFGATSAGQRLGIAPQ